MDKNSVVKGRKGYTKHHSINNHANHSVNTKEWKSEEERERVASCLTYRQVRIWVEIGDGDKIGALVKDGIHYMTEI